MSNPVLLLNLACSLYMTGLIWFVQIVHYPLFSAVGESAFASYEAAHTARTTWVTAPVMLVELAASVLLLMQTIPGIDRRWLWLAGGLTMLLWASTFFLQVPLHSRLTLGYDATAQSALVRTNWIRTVLWTLRSLLLLWLVSRSTSFAGRPDS